MKVEDRNLKKWPGQTLLNFMPSLKRHSEYSSIQYINYKYGQKIEVFTMMHV